MRARHLLPVLFTSLAVGCGQASEEDTGSGEDAVREQVMKDIGSELRGASDTAVLTKNEDALAAKLAIIDRAKSGETLDISYYIFSDDESSALYATRLVAAAKRGVNVRVMLDYLTNFSRYYYFKAMQEEAGDKLQFRYYNKPNANIIEDVKFLVTPCSIEGKGITSTECTQDRNEKSKSEASAQRATLFLSGLYAKNGGAIQAAIGPVVQQFQAERAAAPATSPEDRQKALDAVRLVFDAKVKGDLGAMFLVFLAGDKLAPIHQLWSALVPKAAESHAQDWQHLTDFDHQKLTLRTSADGSGEVVLGGRNVENSYHLSDLPPEAKDGEEWRKKYIFMDVDFRGTYTNAGAIKARFDKVWGFKAMVATSAEVEQLTPPGLKVPTIQDGAVTGETPLLKSYSYKDIETTAKRFGSYATYADGKLTVKFSSAAITLANGGQFPLLVGEDKDARYYYVDNVHNPGNERLFGMDQRYGKELDNGKQINELWIRAIKDLCKKSNDARQSSPDDARKPVEILFHNAYVSLPGRLNYELFERAKLNGNGTVFECEKGVSKVKFLTNSRESTDLSVVNIYNDAWMKTTLEHDRKNFLEYREYNTNEITAKNPIKRSLHAKVMIFGDDVFVGSANADGRSAFMDANNGMFIRNAPKLAKAYRDWLANEIEPSLTIPKEDPRGLRTRKIDAIAADNADYVGMALTAKGHPGLVDPVKKRIIKDSTFIYEDTKKCFDNPGFFSKKCIETLDQLLQPF